MLHAIKPPCSPAFKETFNLRKTLQSPTVRVLKEGKIFMRFNHKYIYIYFKYKYMHSQTLYSHFLCGSSKRRRLSLQIHGNLKQPHLSAELVAHDGTKRIPKHYMPVSFCAARTVHGNIKMCGKSAQTNPQCWRALLQGLNVADK